MARCLIFYYSFNGSTIQIAEHIGTGLLKLGYEVNFFSIDNHKLPEIINYDLLGFGSPVYYFRPAYEMRRFIRNLPGLDGIPAFVFVAYGINRGNAVSELCSLVTNKGVINVGAIACRNVKFIINEYAEAYKSKQIRPEELDQAEAFGIKLAQELLLKTFARKN